jgi:hypothetical protein
VPLLIRMLRAALVFSVAFVALAAGHLVAAEETGELLRIEYRADPSCPDEPAFVARVRARTALFHVVTSGDASRTFKVSLQAGRSPSGRIEIQEAGRAQGARSVSAATCSEVADAIALVAALAIDPRALSANPGLDAGSPDAGALDASPDQGVADAAIDATPEPRVVPPPEVTPPAAAGASEPQDAGQASASEPIGLFAGADLTATTGVAPGGAIVGIAPFLGWRFIRVGFVFASSGTVGVGSAGTAQFDWAIGRLDACPLTLRYGIASASACARIEAGELTAAGVTVASPQSRTSAWFAPGALVRAEFAILPPIFFEAEAALDFRVTQDRYYFLPQVTVQQVPFLGFAGGAGLGAHFL